MSDRPTEAAVFAVTHPSDSYNNNSYNNYDVDGSSAAAAGDDVESTRLQKFADVKSKKSFFKKHRRILSQLFVVLPFTALSMACMTLGAMCAKFSKPMALCDNEECLRMASSLKESMNTSVDPCDDFHEYVCGRWPESHPIRDGYQSQNWLSERQTRLLRRIPDLMAQNFTERRPEVPRAVKEAQILYFSCLDVRAQYKLGLGPLFDLLTELGLPRLPRQVMISGQDDYGSDDFVKQMARVKRLLWSDTFFGLEVYADPRDNGRKLLVLDMPDRLHTPFPRDKSVLQEDDLTRSSNSSSEAYSAMEKLYLVELLKHIVGNGTSDSIYSCKSPKKFDNSTMAKMTDLVNRIVNFTGVMKNINSRYAKKSSNSSEEVDDEDYMLLDELQRLTDDYVRSVNESIVPRPLWRPFVEELLRGLEVDFDPAQQKVYVEDLEFLQEIALVLSSTDGQLLETMVWWRVVEHCVQHTSWGLRRIWNIFFKDETGLGQRKARSIHCSESVNELMGMAVAWLVVEPTFSPDHVAEMLENIKRAFMDFVLKDIDWMDEPTEVATLEKIRKMKSLIGFPDWLFEDGRLDEYYEGINITKDTYFDNMLQIVRSKNIKTLMNLSKNDTNDDNWSNPIKVNAHAFVPTNLIEIPIGILQFPFYGLGLEALNYGAMGSVLGHETTHGFDVDGRHYDSSGNLKQWWSNETIARYTTKATCFVKQYDDYYLPEIDKYVNGKLTLGENIADNGGLRQAYEAYRIWKSKHGDEPLLSGFGNFTHEQLFFLSYAHMWCESLTDDGLLIWISQNSHCPGRVRLQQVLRNSEHFSRAFSCPLGSPMNPKNKCQLW